MGPSMNVRRQQRGSCFVGYEARVVQNVVVRVLGTGTANIHRVRFGISVRRRYAMVHHCYTMGTEWVPLWVHSPTFTFVFFFRVLDA